MPLAEGTLRTPEKRELLLAIIFNAFSSHQENSSLTVWCVLNWATGSNNTKEIAPSKLHLEDAPLLGRGYYLTTPMTHP